MPFIHIGFVPAKGMVLDMILPEQIKRHVINMQCDRNNVGCTQAEVYRYYGMDSSLYLKIDQANDIFRREHDLLLWLSGKLPMPEIMCWHEQDGLAYLLMTEIPGQMCCEGPEGIIREPVQNTVKLLADGFLMLQSLDITDCPFDNTLDIKLTKALYNIENNLVDMEDWNEDNEFTSPMELYNWLLSNKPPEDLCFTHGDYTLPNVFIGGTRVTGFIDVGRGGIADKYQDIAVCCRSLDHNFGDMAGSEKDRYKSLLFSHLDIEPEWDKINYYILLDELF